MNFSIFTGAVVNALAIATGSLIGLALRSSVSRQLLDRLQQAMGMAIFFIGMKMCLEFKNGLILIASLGLGLLVGECFDVQKRSDQLALKIEKMLGRFFQGNFAQGFSYCSILFCTGAMGILGPIESATTEVHQIQFAKALIDGLLSIGLAASMGMGVVFSSVTILLYQGVLTLFASQLQLLTRPEIISEISGVGGALVAMIGLELAQIKKLGVANYLPGLFIAVILTILVAT